jgi:hypothetical protein
MSSTNIRASIGALVCVLCVTSFSRADLFAKVGNSRDVLRIDSATGNVTRTYSIPEWIPLGNSPGILGMAFDGRTLYMTRPTGGPPNELLRLDVVNNIWFPPTLLIDTFPPEANTLLTGLGFHRDEFGFGHLYAVSQNFIPPPHSSVFDYIDVLGFPFDPFTLNSFPPGDLPAGYRAGGADVDPETGDLWVTTIQTNPQGMVIATPVIRVNLDGSILETVEPDFDSPVQVRGLGFDAGAMFVAAREIPTNANTVFEIDRTTGNILRTFDLPGDGAVGALTGGDVIPEPSTAFMAMLALCGITASTPRKRK